MQNGNENVASVFDQNKGIRSQFCNASKHQEVQRYKGLIKKNLTKISHSIASNNIFYD